MRKRLIFGFFVLAVAVVLGLFYYGMRNDAEQSNSHIIPPNLNSASSPPTNNMLESVQSEEAQVSVEEPSEHPEGLQVEQEPQPQSDTTAEESTETPLKGRKVVLEDGREIIIIEDVPDSWKTETEVRFDKEGKAHVTHK